MNAPIRQKAGARYDSVAAIRSAVCAELVRFETATGRMPIARDLERWCGLPKNMGSYHAQRLRMHGLVTFEFGDSLTVRKGKPTKSIFIALTDAGRLAAARSPGIEGAPRAVVTGRTPVEAPPPPPEAPTEKARKARLVDGYRHGTRILVAVLDDEVMSQCVLCRFESTTPLKSWGYGRPQACERCQSEVGRGDQVVAWAADVPPLTDPARPEEREELLDFVLAEIGASPFTALERMDLALAYLREHAPGRSLTLEQVGLAVGVTRERIRQIEAKALKRLRMRFVNTGEATDLVEALRDIDNTRDRED